jgi:hypothetical protein
MDATLARAARASSKEQYKKISLRNISAKMVTTAVKLRWSRERNVKLAG